MDQPLNAGDGTNIRLSHVKVAGEEDRDETIKHIEFCDRRLNALDRKARSLSIKTNWTYWHLGKVFEAFCLVSTAQKISLVFFSYHLRDR
jgi:hypothetical protein